MYIRKCASINISVIYLRSLKFLISIILLFCAAAALLSVCICNTCIHIVCNDKFRKLCENCYYVYIKGELFGNECEWILRTDTCINLYFLDNNVASVIRNICRKCYPVALTTLSHLAINLA